MTTDGTSGVIARNVEDFRTGHFVPFSISIRRFVARIRSASA